MKKCFFFALLLCGLNKVKAQEIPNFRAQDTVYNVVDTLPSFPGGNEGWQKYLKKNLKYPKIAWREEVEGTVTIDFIVRKDGTIDNVRHITVVGWGFEEEAIRLVKQSGKWIPAIKRGRKVDYHAQLPIEFKLKRHD
jgi:protein TonB